MTDEKMLLISLLVLFIAAIIATGYWRSSITRAFNIMNTNYLKMSMDYLKMLKDLADSTEQVHESIAEIEEELEEVDRKVNMLIAPIIPDDEDDSSC